MSFYTNRTESGVNCCSLNYNKYFHFRLILYFFIVLHIMCVIDGLIINSSAFMSRIYTGYNVIAVMTDLHVPMSG